MKQILLFSFGLLCMFSTTIHAQQSLQISPTSVNLSRSQRIVPVTIKNKSDHPFILKTEVVRWTKQNIKDKENKDIYTPSRDLLVTPPVSQVKPGETRTLRIGLVRDPGSPDKEVMYRVYLTQLPIKKKGEQGVNIHLHWRFGIPVGVLPDKPIYKMTGKAIRKNDTLQTTYTNIGNSRIKVLKLVLRNTVSDKIIQEKELHSSLFPGESEDWSLTLKQPLQGPVKLQLITSPGHLEHDIAIQ
jgi:fimbrial chaperone protein